MMTEEIAQLLKVMHLRRMAEILDEELVVAEKEQRSYQDLLARLLRAQWHSQQQKALGWRIDRARLPERWTLETFPFKKQPGVSQKQIRGLAELDFIGKAENIVLIGPTGSARRASRRGYCSRRCRAVTGAFLCELKTSSTRCTRLWQIARAAS